MSILENLLLALLFFIIQPTFIVGLFLVVLTKIRRFKYARNQLRATVYKENYEVKRFFLWGLIPGAILSILSLFIGLPITIDWLIVYQIVTLLSLGLGYRFIHPIFTFSLTSILLLLINQFISSDSLTAPLLSNWNSPFIQEETLSFGGAQIILVLTLLILLSTILTLHIGKQNQFTPRFLKTKRGKLIARYRMNPMWLLPLLVVIPGDTFTSLFEWWPVFTIGSESYSFLILPILVGFRYTVQAQMPTDAKNALLKDFVVLGIVGTVLFLVSLWRIELAVFAILILLIGGVYVLYRHRKRERKWKFLFSPAQAGLRVIGVRPNSPAEKMNIEIGDVLLEANQVKLNTMEELTESLFNNRAYCRLKIQRIDGELVLEETAIYEDDPHDLGLITLEEITTIK